jgi:hypothetical protein
LSFLFFNDVQINNVTYNTEPNDLANTDDKDIGARHRCPIPLQKETPTGLVDTTCIGDVENGFSGLCK